MPNLSRYANGTTYECRPEPKTGIYYIHWSEGGRSKRKTTGTRDVREAQAFFDEWCDLSGSVDAAPRYTCDELFHMRYTKADERAMSAWANLKPWFGAKEPREVSQELVDRYSTARGVAPSTLRYELSVLRTAWNSAVKQRLIRLEDTPVLAPLPPASPPRERWLTDVEIDKVLAAAEQPGLERVRMFSWLALHTGARRTAICELRWPQVDFEVGVIHYLPPGAQQTRKRRASVPVSDALRAVLWAAYEARQHDNALVIGTGGKINEPIRRLGKLAGVSGLTPHVFRHTAGTVMARNGVPLWVIAKILGNTVEEVEKTYAKWVPGLHTDAVNIIGRRAA